MPLPQQQQHRALPNTVPQGIGLWMPGEKRLPGYSRFCRGPRPAFSTASCLRAHSPLAEAVLEQSYLLSGLMAAPIVMLVL